MKVISFCNGVQIDSDAEYTGEKPVQITEAAPVTSVPNDLSANTDIWMGIARLVN